jgi:hypothetical protein
VEEKGGYEEDDAEAGGGCKGGGEDAVGELRIMMRAREVAKWRQMLDTEKDSPAELVYPRLGYIRVSDLS